MRIADFDYDLPDSCIAQAPLAERDASRLMLLARQAGPPRHARFSDLPDLLAPGDLLVVNRSRVFPARLLGVRPGGGAAELLLVRPLDERRWLALLKPGRRLRPGTRVRIAADFEVEIESGDADADGARPVRLIPPPELSIDQALDAFGHTPLPPYIQRPDDPGDRERYQSVYARERGSIAAPTAGLHFTDALLARCAARGVQCVELVLHVGPGTFRPVKVDDVTQHHVDPERFFIPEATAAAVAATRARGGRVVAVGTTTTRALEAAANAARGVVPGPGQTALVITPGYAFRVADGLVTNFHLPRSSLLLLVAAFAGRERVLAAYAEAVRLGYRFYSFGDAMLLL